MPDTKLLLVELPFPSPRMASRRTWIGSIGESSSGVKLNFMYANILSSCPLLSRKDKCYYIFIQVIIKDLGVRLMISIPASLSFGKLVMMSSAPAKSAGCPIQSRFHTVLGVCSLYVGRNKKKITSPPLPPLPAVYPSIINCMFSVGTRQTSFCNLIPFSTSLAFL